MKIETLKRWFWAVIALSILVRLYLAIFTQGTYDIGIWERHAEAINKTGLIEYYKESSDKVTRFNHPPLMGLMACSVLSLSRLIRVPFGVLFRLLFVPIDFFIAFYIFKIFSSRNRGYLYAALYLISPLVFIFSSYHGNTDTALGLSMVMSLYYLSRNRPALAGAIFGIGMWVKWAMILAGPVLFFSIPDLKNRARFALSSMLAAGLGYVWFFAKEPGVVIASVFGYGGQMIQTTAGVAVWGNRIFLERFIGPAFVYYLKYNSLAILVAVVLFSWLRRRRNSAPETGESLGRAFCIFYAMTNFWSFQYLAWSLPFWVFMSLPVFLTLSFFATAYIYLLYALLCGSYLLLGKWDFVNHPFLSGPVLFFRNALILVFAAFSVYFLYAAVAEEIKNSRKAFSLC